MKVSGFTYFRNAIALQYPCIAAIKSVLSIVDEMIVVIGDSNDGSREAVEALNDPKIKIVDTVWDMDLRVGGKVFAQQSNIGIDNISKDTDWALHVQADEVIHENDLPKIKDAMIANLNNPKVDGIALPFLHFFGSYNYYRHTRRTHPIEVRLFKTNKLVRSYRDSQGFRIYKSLEQYESNQKKGSKLKVKLVNAPIYHYSFVRNPMVMAKKGSIFKSFYDNGKEIKREEIVKIPFDFNEVDELTKFNGTHPEAMTSHIKKMDWKFEYDPSKSNMKLKDKFLNALEKKTSLRPFDYKNYKIVK